jgi:CDP-diacylglycerol--glycerol-3-phosphate 3-phosphatidyltransferase
MFSDRARQKTEGAVTAIASVVAKTGITPNMITVIGCSFMFLIGYVISQGHLALGGALIVFAGAFDALDGALARYSKTVTKFGGFLDSVTDRYAEFAIFTGILHYMLAAGYPVMNSVYLVLLALFGSIMVSYNRARAEGLAFECKGGWFSRFERLVVLVGGLVLTAIFGDTACIAALVILAVFTNITAVQRILLVKEADDAANAVAKAKADTKAE